MELIVFLLLIPVIVIVVGTWAWRYHVRLLHLLQSAADDRAGLREVRLAEVAVTDRDRVDLLVEDVARARQERYAVAVDEPSVALATLQRWHHGRARLRLIVPAGRNVVRLRRRDGLEALTLRRYVD